MPAAYAAPLILAMVGFGSSLSVRIIALIVFALAKFSASLPAAMRRIQSRSAPAENAAPRENDNPRFAIGAQRLECIGQRMDDMVVDRVAHLRTVDRDGGNAARVLGDENGRFAHLISLRRRSLSTGEIVRLH